MFVTANSRLHLDADLVSIIVPVVHIVMGCIKCEVMVTNSDGTSFDLLMLYTAVSSARLTEMGGADGPYRGSYLSVRSTGEAERDGFAVISIDTSAL